MLALLGLAQHDAAQLAFSVALIAAVSWLVNRAFAFAFRIPANSESVWITRFDHCTDHAAGCGG